MRGRVREKEREREFGKFGVFGARKRKRKEKEKESSRLDLSIRCCHYTC